MNSTSPSVDYTSSTENVSNTTPGVRYRIARMSFARRLDLGRRVKEMAQKIEFLEAGGGELRDKVESSLLGGEIDRMYLEWGLQTVDGLSIDGEPATPALLMEKGPEALSREIVAAIRAECHLSEEERKN